jgi:lysophospholipase L1-like esterase
MLRGLSRMLVLVVLVLDSTISQAQLLKWAPSWTASLYRLEPDALIADDQLTDATLRQAVRLSIGGERIRIVLSNAAGGQALAISGVHVAMSGPPGTASIQPHSDREVLFDQRAGVIVPAGGNAISDAVELRVPPLARLSISMHFATPPEQQTGHLRSLSSSWIAHGDQLGAATLSSAASVEHWYQLAAVQVEAPDPRVIVAFGDSITDGSKSTTNGNNRWPDLFAERLQASSSTSRWAVANQGLAGNRLLAYGRGPSALARFDQDVLSQPNARTVLVLEGINDLGQFAQTTPQTSVRQAFVKQILGAYRLLISRARAHGLRIIGGTLLPYSGSDYHPTPLDEEDRQAINEWIRAPGHFDLVIDWDAVMRDLENPSRLKPEFDSGDHIHPSPSGYRAMVDAIPMGEFLH